MTRKVRAGLVAAVVAALASPGPGLAAGNVEALVKGGNVVITGDAEANGITVDQVGLGAGELRITTLNGAAAPAVFTGVTKGVVAKLGDGNDLLEFELGNGMNAAYLNPTSSVGGDVSVKMGSVDDRVFIDQVAFKGNVQLVLNAGANEVTCTDSSIAGNLTVKTGAGDDSVDTTGTRVSGQTKIDLDGGTNTVVP